MATESISSDRPPDVTRVLLIRHGSNDYVKKGLLAGRLPDVHLNDEGLMQAAALAARLGGQKIAAVYGSPLERCQETAAALAERLGLVVDTVEALAETDCGGWTGQVVEELRRTSLWPQLQSSACLFRYPDGESILEIQARMVAAVERLREKHTGKTIAVVSHADPIKLTLTHYLGLGLDLFQRLEVAPTSISELAFMPHGVRLARLNDCGHVPPRDEDTVPADAAERQPPDEQLAD